MAKRGTIADYTPAKLKKFISDNADALGDITSVTAGTGLSGGGTSGAVTVNLDLADVISSDTENRLLTSDGDGSLYAAHCHYSLHTTRCPAVNQLLHRF